MVFFNRSKLVLGRYKCLKFIDQGGEAIVHKGRDTRDGKNVTIKQLAMSPQDKGYQRQAARFKRAFDLGLVHPNLIQSIDFGEEKGNVSLISTYVDGQDLNKYLVQQGGKLSPENAQQIILSAAKGLDAAHQKGVIHRDVKEENFILTPDGKIVIIDFTVCRLLMDQTLSGNGDMIGTLRVMSPQHVNNSQQVEAVDDLYSLGTILYRLLTGQFAVTGNSTKEIINSIFQYVPPAPSQIVPSIPPYLDQICMKLLAKDRESRVQSAQELITALENKSPVASGPNQCSACHKALNGPVKFCPSCGADMNSAPAVVRCIACGNPIGNTPACHWCSRSFGRSNHCLKFIKGALTGVTFRIPEGLYIVGRNELLARDFQISRQHLSIQCLNGTVLISDAGSANKTYIGSQCVSSPIQILPGQQLCIAGNIAVYQMN